MSQEPQRFVVVLLATAGIAVAVSLLMASPAEKATVVMAAACSAFVALVLAMRARTAGAGGLTFLFVGLVIGFAALAIGAVVILR